MGMPITVEICDHGASDHMKQVFDYFRTVDERYSPYKETSELSAINNGLPKKEWSEEMRAVLGMCEETEQQTDGFFNIRHRGKLDPSGLVKGWAIQQAADQLCSKGYKNFYIEAGGDIQVYGNSLDNEGWRVGIRNPFNTQEVVKVIQLSDYAVATSGTYIRGEHIYNPHNNNRPAQEAQSLTVIGPTIYDADRFATAAFAMGKQGMAFIDQLPGFEAYMITDQQTAILTKGFEKYVVEAH